MASGGRLAHRWCKPAPVWSEPPCDSTGFALTPQAAADSVAGVWHRLWDVDSPEADEEAKAWKTLCEEALSQEAIVPPSVEAIRQTAATFSRFTAVGGDNLHPKHIGRLSEGGTHTAD